MEIKTVEELKEALSNNKIVEWEATFRDSDSEWMEHWEVMKCRLKNGYKCRTKPEKEYIQFTADDWREFLGYVVTSKDSEQDYNINSWNLNGVILSYCYGGQTHYVSYKKIFKEYYLRGLKHPCGKEVLK